MTCKCAQIVGYIWQLDDLSHINFEHYLSSKMTSFPLLLSPFGIEVTQTHSMLSNLGY